jgi:DNA-directed RNA polymerase specialized sigma24 family protein
MNGQRPISHAVFLKHELWQTIPETASLQYNYNHGKSGDGQRKNGNSAILAEISRIINTRLTARQRDTVTLYYYEGFTQVDTAEKLGITQPTVNQHLYGKKRNGKYVGGACAKIRKHVDAHVKNGTASLAKEQKGS